MAPAGLAKVDGSWNALDSATALETPSDLEAGLDALPSARANFDAFPPSARRVILEWISLAKKPETRAGRVDETAAKPQRTAAPTSGGSRSDRLEHRS
jgi:uncharacterized protein YdeI (YjbR/CyaY-like superfamily)